MIVKNYLLYLLSQYYMFLNIGLIDKNLLYYFHLILMKSNIHS